MADVRVLGIDIGSSSLKIAGVRKGSGGYAVRVLAIEPLPTPDDIKDADERLRQIKPILEEMVGRHGLKNQRCALSVTGPDVAPRHFSFPEMDPELVGNAIRMEAMEVLPFDVDEASIDFHVFPPRESGPSAGKTEGIFIAAKNDLVEAQCELLYACQLEPVIVDTASLAIANTFLEVGGGAPPERTTMIINIGRANTNCVVLTPDGRSYIRDVAIGGAQMTAAVATNLSVPAGQAEEIKTGGVLGQPNTPDRLKRLAPVQDALLQQGLGDTIEQITETLRHFVAQRYIEDIDELWVTGGGAAFPGVPAYLAQELGVPAQGWNPLQDVSLAGVPAGKDPAFVDSVGPMFAVALGLAMRPDIM